MMMAVGKGSIEQKTGYELIKNSVSNKTQQLLAPFNEGISSLYDQIKDALKLKQAAQKIEEMASKAEEFTNQKLTDLALSIDPSLVVNGEKSKKNSSDTGQTVGENNNSKQVNNTINQANPTKQTPEKSNKEDFLDLNKAKERIPSVNKLSTLWIGQNKTIESLKDHEAVDNIQAAALVYIHNGINSGDTISHPLSPAGEIKLATVLAVELLQSMKLNDKQLADLSAKLTNNPASKKIGIGGTIADVTKGIQDSGMMDIINGATSFMKVFNGAKPILEKANTMMDLLREGSSNFDAKNMTISQLHQLYQSCINKSFPSADQIVTITKQTQTDEQWYAGKLKSLTISPAALTFIKEHLTELPFLDAESTKKTQELAKSVEEGMDSVYDVVGQWFGAEKGSAMMDKWIESLMKFFDNPFLGALANMAGIDLSKIKQTLSGEFTPAQEEQFEQVVSKYNDLPNADGNWVARLGGWISDTTSERYKALEKFNMKYLNDHLGAATPHVSVVQSLVGNDETLKAKYLTTKSVTKDGVTTEQVVVKEGVLDNIDNKKELAGLFCANDTMVKSVIESTKWTTSQDVAGLLTAQWMKGDIRGVRAWTKYQEKNKSKNNKEDKTKDVETNSESNVVAESTALGVGAFAKLKSKMTASNVGSEFTGKNFNAIDEGQTIAVFKGFFDSQNKYPDTVNKLINFWRSKQVEYGGDIRSAMKLSMFVPIAEYADAIRGYTGSVNNDPTPGNKNKTSYQFSTPDGGKIIQQVVNEHRERGMKLLNVTEKIQVNDILDQYICWIGYLDQKHSEGKESFESLLKLNPNSSDAEYLTRIRDNVQIGGKGFETHTWCKKMMNGKIEDMFDLNASTIASTQQKQETKSKQPA